MKKQLEKLIKEYRDLQPLDEDCKKKLDKKFRLEFNYNSNHLEGNTLTYGETELLLLFDQTKGNHELRELEEMKAHDVALMLIKEEAADREKPLTEKFIKDLNQTILVRPFWKDAITSEGQSTRRQIKIGEYKEFPNSVIQANGEIFEYASPQETPILMAELLQWYNDEVTKGEFSAIELAALLHYRYIRIHPFDDGNGRVARLLVNYVLYYNDLPPVIIKTSDKREYLRALQQADTGDLQAFINYMIQQLAWSLDVFIKAAKGESVEEQDDWEKQLSLLKRSFDYGDDIISEKRNKDSLWFTYENVIEPFLLRYEQEISKFDTLFENRKTTIKISAIENEFSYSYPEELRVNIQAIFDYFLNRLKDLPTSDSFGFVSAIDINSSLIGLKNEKSIDIEVPSVLFTFNKDGYSLYYPGQGKSIENSYVDILTNEEVKLIISRLAKVLLEQIEEVIRK